MMLGKRGRPPMKRTTSMTEFTLNLNGVVLEGNNNPFNGAGGGLEGQLNSPSSASPRPRRRNSADLMATANFLRACALCKHSLIPGHDIYMYRGDSAFCSLECRQQQMTQDERKDKCCSVSSKTQAPNAAPPGLQPSATA